MKVIKKGSGQNGWSKEFECTGHGNGDGGCGAILLVEQNDLYKTYKHDHGGGHEVFTTFRCSECSVETDITVPSNIYVRESEHKPRPCISDR